MLLVAILALLVLIFGGLGFAVHALWIIALVVLVCCGVAYLLGARR